MSFYRTKLPRYAAVIHPGGAPDWVVKKWMLALTGKSGRTTPQQVAEMVEETPVVKLIGQDLSRIGEQPSSADDVVASLLDTFVSEEEDGVCSTGPESIPSNTSFWAGPAAHPSTSLRAGSLRFVQKWGDRQKQKLRAITPELCDMVLTDACLFDATSAGDLVKCAAKAMRDCAF